MLHLRTAYEREQNPSKSRQPLSIAQIIALQSVDVETVALIWLLLEHGASLTIGGPTQPLPGAGKTTALYALLQLLPAGTALAHMSGKYETFAFTHLSDIDPARTYAVCNEISDHQVTYMWGRVARRYLTLPALGYHIATTVHADRMEDVLHLYQHDLQLRIEDIGRLGLIVNIGLLGQGKSRRRRWLTSYFLLPQPQSSKPEALRPLLLSSWKASDDTFEHASSSALDELADWAGLTSQDFTVSLERRTECLKGLVQGTSADMNAVQDAISQFRRLAHKLKV